MNTIISSLSELVKALTDTLRLSSIFPALVFILLNRIIVLPNFAHLPYIQRITGESYWDQTFIIGLFVFLLGYIISANEVPIVRLYEGYSWQNTLPGWLLTKYYRNRFNNLSNQLESLERELRDEYANKKDQAETSRLDLQIKIDRGRLKNEFPSEIARVLPTKLGNVIAAFEEYPKDRYGMDGVTSWIRILPILDREGYLPYVSNARSTLDFLLNMNLLMYTFGFECIVLRVLFISQNNWLLVLSAFLAAEIFYRAAIVTASTSWAASFQVAFDLFRYHLATALGITVTCSFEEERTQWDRISVLWNNPKQFDSSGIFRHSREKWPV